MLTIPISGASESVTGAEVTEETMPQCGHVLFWKTVLLNGVALCQSETNRSFLTCDTPESGGGEGGGGRGEAEDVAAS